MTLEEAIALTPREYQTACPHLRRKLDTPAGQYVKGVCVACGDVRVYSSAGDEQTTNEFVKRQQAAVTASLDTRRRKGPGITLPRANEPVRVFAVAYERRIDITDKQRACLDVVRTKGEASVDDVSRALAIGPNNAGDRLRALVARGVLVREIGRSHSQVAYVYRLADA
jgi:ethanolamine ammonia-lyase small subunit